MSRLVHLRKVKKDLSVDEMFLPIRQGECEFDAHKSEVRPYHRNGRLRHFSENVLRAPVGSVFLAPSVLRPLRCPWTGLRTSGVSVTTGRLGGRVIRLLRMQEAPCVVGARAGGVVGQLGQTRLSVGIPRLQPSTPSARGRTPLAHREFRAKGAVPTLPTGFWLAGPETRRLSATVVRRAYTVSAMVQVRASCRRVFLSCTTSQHNSLQTRSKQT